MADDKPEGTNPVNDGENAETNSGTAEEGRQQGAPQQLPYEIYHQYIKDLSYENPSAGEGFDANGPKPEVNISIDISTRRLENRMVEVTLHVEAKAHQAEKTIYLLELAYAAVVEVRNVPKEALSALIYVEIPRFLFPFARQIVADTTRNGGFTQLLMAPFDFVQFYRQRIAAQQQAEAEDNGAENTA